MGTGNWGKADSTRHGADGGVYFLGPGRWGYSESIGQRRTAALIGGYGLGILAEPAAAAHEMLVKFLNQIVDLNAFLKIILSLLPGACPLIARACHDDQPEKPGLEPLARRHGPGLDRIRREEMTPVDGNRLIEQHRKLLIGDRERRVHAGQNFTVCLRPRLVV